MTIRCCYNRFYRASNFHPSLLINYSINWMLYVSKFNCFKRQYCCEIVYLLFHNARNVKLLAIIKLYCWSSLLNYIFPLCILGALLHNEHPVFTNSLFSFNWLFLNIQLSSVFYYSWDEFVGFSSLFLGIKFPESLLYVIKILEIVLKLSV